jgi:RNA polymerase sigma-70 factor (ECF subfamily)
MELFISKSHNKYIEELYSRYSPRILGYFCRLYHGDIDKSQDLLQDLFVKVIEKKEQYDSSRKFYTWIFTVASNLSKSDLRKLSNRNSAREFSVDKTPTQLDANLYDTQEFKKSLKTSIANLSHAHRVVFVLRYNEKFSVKEIADIVEVSEGTVKSRLYYATQNVSKELQEFSPVNEAQIFKSN